VGKPPAQSGFEFVSGTVLALGVLAGTDGQELYQGNGLIAALTIRVRLHHVGRDTVLRDNQWLIERQVSCVAFQIANCFNSHEFLPRGALCQGTTLATLKVNVELNLERQLIIDHIQSKLNLLVVHLFAFRRLAFFMQDFRRSFKTRP
jgi:hypothetical protein